MKKINKLTAAVIIVLTVFGTFFVSASAAYNRDYKYIVKENEIIITAYIGRAETVSIPSEIDNKPVTVISSNAFKGTKVTSVTIPGTVETIGNSAFQDCKKLSTISIPDSVVSIGARAFDDTAYANDKANWKGKVLYICNHLIVANNKLAGRYEVRTGTCTIAAEAFNNCKDLTEVVIPASVKLIARHAFMGCKKLEKVTFAGNSKLQVLENAAFYDCTALKEVNVPETCKEEADNAFFNCTALA